MEALSISLSACYRVTKAPKALRCLLFLNSHEQPGRRITRSVVDALPVDASTVVTRLAHDRLTGCFICIVVAISFFFTGPAVESLTFPITFTSVQCSFSSVNLTASALHHV